jgi:uncharacterized protein with ACT and thioredoxin-like domain
MTIDELEVTLKMIDISYLKYGGILSPTKYISIFVKLDQVSEYKELIETILSANFEFEINEERSFEEIEYTIEY